VALLEDSLRSKQLAEQLAGKIAAKSDGNPFFAFEIIRGLREGQFLTQEDDGTWVSTRVIDDIQVPSSVVDLVNARVADLTQEERDLLDVACCWGYEFDPALVADVVGEPLLKTLKRFATIEKRHRLVRASGRRLIFDHHQVQEALYEALYEQMREAYHAALADALATRTHAAATHPDELDGALCVDLCEHYLKGARGEDATRYLEAAQAHLSGGYMHAQVEALTERALAVPDLLTGVERAKALLRLAAALDQMGRRTRQEECVREAGGLAESAGNGELRSRAATALGAFFMGTSRHEEAEASYRRALEFADDRRAQVEPTVRLGIALFRQDRLPEARECYERGLAIGRELGDMDAEAHATLELGNVAYNQGRFDDALEHYERCLALCRETGNRRRQIAATANLASVLSFQGQSAKAREHAAASLALAREMGERASEAATTGLLGAIFRTLGRLSEARGYTERYRDICREIGDRHGEAVALVNLGSTWQQLGDRVRARAALEQSLAICREVGARYPEGYALLGLGQLADEEGQPDEALRLTNDSLSLRREIGHEAGAADSLIELGDVHLRAGETDGARAALDEAAGLCREQGRAAELALAQALLACLPGDDSAAALATSAEVGDEGDTPRRRWLLHRATGDRAHLDEAKRLIDESLAKVPEEHHEAMLTNSRVNRGIMAAWAERGGD
jgi:tetratricopeptide (TPR) repeat protein